MYAGWILMGVVATLAAVWSVKHQLPVLLKASGWLMILYGLFTVVSVLVAAAVGCSSNPFGYGYSTSARARDCDNFVTDILLHDYELLVALVVGLLAFSSGVGILRYAHRLSSVSSQDTKHPPPRT
jgi:hypothetical protein